MKSKVLNVILLLIILLLLLTGVNNAGSVRWCQEFYCIEQGFVPYGYYSRADVHPGYEATFVNTQATCYFLNNQRTVECIHRIAAPPEPTPPPLRLLPNTKTN